MDHMPVLAGVRGQIELPIIITTTPENRETSPYIPRRRRISPAEEEILAIYEDPDTRDSSQRPFREYYGDNVPALAEITNGQDFQYQKRHNLVRHAAALKKIAVEGGDIQVFRVLRELERQERVTLEKLVTGFYEWTPLQNINNVWLWIAAHNYQARWTSRQQKKFRDMLARMSAEVRRTHAGSLTSCEAQTAVEDMCSARLAALKIYNIVVVAKGPCMYRFCPVGESKPQHRLRDFPGTDRWDVECLYYDYLVKEDSPVKNNSESPNPATDDAPVNDPWASVTQGDASEHPQDSAASMDSDGWGYSLPQDGQQDQPEPTQDSSPSTNDAPILDSDGWGYSLPQGGQQTDAPVNDPWGSVTQEEASEHPQDSAASMDSDGWGYSLPQGGQQTDAPVNDPWGSVTQEDASEHPQDSAASMNSDGWGYSLPQDGQQDQPELTQDSSPSTDDASILDSDGWGYSLPQGGQQYHQPEPTQDSPPSRQDTPQSSQDTPPSTQGTPPSTPNTPPPTPNTPPPTPNTPPPTPNTSPSTPNTLPSTQGTAFFADLSFLFPALQTRSGGRIEPPSGPPPVPVDRFAGVRRIADGVRISHLDAVASRTHRRSRPRNINDQLSILGELQDAVAEHSRPELAEEGLGMRSVVGSFGSLQL